MTDADADHVVWHDVECGAYRADLSLWRDLADAAGGPVLDVGAGTGRVSLDLAARGHEVIALDADPVLLAALSRRGAGLPVSTVHADMRRFDLGRRVALVVVPMQTLQLLDGPGDRRAFLDAARRHLEPGGILAAALADPLDGMAPDDDALPLPDILEIHGTVYASQPLAVRPGPDGTEIERVRQRVAPDGALVTTADVILVRNLPPAVLETELAGAGFAPRPRRAIAPTTDHVGSAVVLAAAPAAT